MVISSKGKDIKHLFQPPNISNTILRINTNIIYGRKGSGKSTLIDYLEILEETAVIIKIPTRNTAFFNRVLSLASEKDIDDRILEETISSALELHNNYEI
jgi:ABC-type lipoprotein export system ATPase subunit